MEYAPVNYERVHSEFKRAGVNLKLLWNEYLIDCKDTGKLPCGYTKFCEDYHKYIEKTTSLVLWIGRLESLLKLIGMVLQ